jgi:hypothetical protein
MPDIAPANPAITVWPTAEPGNSNAPTLIPTAPPKVWATHAHHLAR